MLHAVDRDGLGAAADVQDAFDTQHVLTAHREQQIQPGIEHGVRDRLLDENSKRLDVIIMPIHIVRMAVAVAVAVIVIVIVVMMMAMLP